MWVELFLFAVAAASGVLGWRWLRRPDTYPTTYWVAGWVSAGAAGVLTVVRHDYPWAQYLSYPLGSLFPGLLLAGAMTLAARPVPSWLLPAAAAFGAVRALVAATIGVAPAYGLSLAVEPFVVLAAAWFAFRAIPPTGASRSERLLAPSFLVLGAVGAVHVASMLVAGELRPELLVLWVVMIPPLLGIQLQADWQRVRRALQDSRDELEKRVVQRTQELARLNASLQQEVAERRAAVEALRVSEERHRVISELSSDLAFGFRIGPDDRLYDGWVSDAFTRITGYTIEELTGLGWLGLVHPDDLEDDRRQFEDIVAGRAREFESRLVTRDRRVATVRARLDISPVRADGTRTVVGAARDVTEVRRAEEERRKLELHMFETQRVESLAILTGGIAHDFNNLLAVILGNARMALADAPPGSTLRDRLGRIRTAADHGARLTEQMLAYSGKSPIALKPLELSSLVDEMSDLLRASVSERCRLELDLSGRAPVEGDTTQLRQVVLNLATNASESLREDGGTVRVSTGIFDATPADLAGAVGATDPLPGRYASIAVSDDGAGMDAPTRARIFEPFFTTKFSGRGLGLAAVAGIVRAHRGFLQVRSEVGRGSTIRVLLPLGAATLAPSDARPADPARVRRRATVLIVDDDDSVLEVAQVFLERAGHRVLTAIGGREGIQRFRERSHEIDVVLLDLAMPDATGDVVLRELRSIRPDVRVVIATGLASERVRAQDVAGFVRKPFEPDELAGEIDRAFVTDVPAERRIDGAP